MVRKEIKEEKRRRIVAAAAEVFAQNGYHGTRMVAVANQAGIGKGTIYEYYASKDDLFFGVFQWFMEQSGSAVKVGISALGQSAAQRLRIMNDTLVGTWVEMIEAFSLAMEFWSAASTAQKKERFKAAFRDGYRDFRKIIAAILEDGIQRGEFDPRTDTYAVAAALIGTWDAIILQAWFDDTFDALTVAHSFMEVVLKGLAPGANNPPKGGSHA